MPLLEILPNVHSLSRVEKLRLIQLLAQELAREEEPPIEVIPSYPASPTAGAFGAAAVLLQALEAEQPRT